MSEFDIHTYLRWNLGVVLSALGITGALFGFATSQFGFYVRHYWHGDRPLLKAMVSFVWGLDLFHLALYFYTIYFYLVFQHDNIANQLILPWTSYAQVLINSLLVYSVQMFYLYRIWALSKNYLITVLLSLLSAGNLGTGIVLMIKTMLADTVPELSELSDYSLALNSLTAAADILITLTLVTLLYMSRTSGSRNKRLISRLMFYPINTGLLTSFCAILTVVMIVTEASTNLYILFYYIGARLYTICMIASLNARDGLRSHMAEARGITSIPPAISRSDHSGSKLQGLRKYTLFGTQRSSGSGSHGGDAVVPPTPSSGGKPRPLGEQQGASDHGPVTLRKGGDGLAINVQYRVEVHHDK